MLKAVVGSALLLACMEVQAGAMGAGEACPVPRGSKGFPGGFSICWSDPEVRVGSTELLDVLADPKNYDIMRYGNPVSGVLLKPHAKEARLLMARGQLYVELDSMGEPRETAAGLDRIMGVAGDVWDTRHDFIEQTASDPSLWQVVSGDGWHRFVRLQSLPGSEETKGGSSAASDDAEPVALKDLSDDDLASRLQKLAPVRIDGRKILIRAGQFGALIKIGTRENLSPSARDVYDELVDRFRKEAAQELKERSDGPAKDPGCAAYCYDVYRGEYIGEVPEKECLFRLTSGKTCR